MRKGNGISADVLGDAAGFTGGDIGLTNDIQQSRFAVIHMPHDCDYRRARGEVLEFILDIELHFFNRRVDESAASFALLDFKPVAVIGTNALGDGLVNGLVYVGKDTQAHQVGDDFEWLLFELVGQLADDDGRLDRDDLGIGRQGDFGGGLLPLYGWLALLAGEFGARHSGTGWRSGPPTHAANVTTLGKVGFSRFGWA